MTNLENIKAVYFIGIGGIGMSALARYFHTLGYAVAGYDLVKTGITRQLEAEGMDINYTEDPENIQDPWKDEDHTLVVYTPAIPSGHRQMKYFRYQGFIMLKRAEVLGLVTHEKESFAVAGTHGKTTVSTMLAMILKSSGENISAFLGGISKNLNSNVLISTSEDSKVVVEADEYDRSFLKLLPKAAIVTSMDPDHLDIYGDHEHLKQSFGQFISGIQKEGWLLIRKGLNPEIPAGLKTYSYSLLDKEADYYLSRFEAEKAGFRFDLSTPQGIFKGFRSHIPGRLNLENAVAALAMAHIAGVGEEMLKKGMENFAGVKRRFEVVSESEKYTYIDDYAHHPEELRAFIESVRETFPQKKITGIFQPHLFSRTKDFATGFSESLSLLDNVILIPIYPAREEPMPGVSSELILKGLHNQGLKVSIQENELEELVRNLKPEVLLSMGAGNIDLQVNTLKKIMREIHEETD